MGFYVLGKKEGEKGNHGGFDRGYEDGICIWILGMGLGGCGCGCGCMKGGVFWGERGGGMGGWGVRIFDFFGEVVDKKRGEVGGGEKKRGGGK